MAELTINQLIKLIIGILVIVAVVWGVYYVFKNHVAVFISNVGGTGNSSFKFILSLI